MNEKGPAPVSRRGRKRPPKPTERALPIKPGRHSTIPPGQSPAWTAVGLETITDARALVDYLSRVVLQHHKEAIIAGDEPDGPHQPGFKPDSAAWRLAAQNRRSKSRGFSDRPRKSFPYKIRRSKAKVTKTSAKVVIRPGTRHRGFVAAEYGRGVRYLSLDGEMAEMLNEAAAMWLELAIAGRVDDTPTIEDLDADAAFPGK